MGFWFKRAWHNRIPGPLDTAVEAANLQHLEDGLYDLKTREYDPRDWGAKFDGVTDDTVALNTCASDVNSVGGGKIKCPRGIAITQGIRIYSNVHWEGAGEEATVIKLKNHTALHTGNGTGDVFISYLFQTLAHAQYTSPAGTGDGTSQSTTAPHSWSISHMTIDGNRANQSAGEGGCGIRSYGYDHSFHHAVIRECKDAPVISEHCLPDVVTPNAMEAKWGWCKFHDCGRGPVWDGPHDSVFEIVWSYGHDNGSVNFDWRTKSAGSMFWGCHPWATNLKPSSVAMKVACSGTRIIGGMVEGFYGHGIGIHLLNNDIHVIGPIIQPGNANDGIGIKLGVIAGATAYGCMVDTYLVNCLDGSFDFANGGNHKIRALLNQPTGPKWVTAPDNGSDLDIYNNAQAAGNIKRPPYPPGGNTGKTHIWPSAKAGAPVDGDFDTAAFDGVIAVDITTAQERLFIKHGGGTWIPTNKMPTYTIATLPAAAAGNAGQVVYVSDGASGQKFRGSDGAAWVNLG